MNGGIPIIKLEVEHMRQTLLVALTDYTARLDSDIKAAVEAYCTPDNLTAVIQGFANRTLESIIKEEVTNFFRYGKGREVIKAAVEKRLRDETTYTPLDSSFHVDA